ncbi:hypothetical protein BTO18_06515 [Polaribacter porphyrae]|uniref:EF-hand domain-containing protein n=2 Tax=Polaribacter porphyrae TaxID=1137780 RepID=A0A2S7WTL6_9FLAO|nr:hypothetical protein BTO18_06515 [Polaribacter porphyrae]
MMSCKNKTTLEHHSHSHTHSEIADNHLHEPQNYFSSYNLIDEEFGTKTIVTVQGNTRKMVTNALPNHKTGEFPTKGNPNTISEQSKTYIFPVNPKYTGKPKWAREPGVSINGVKFEPGTAEVVVCDTGENYRVEAFQNVIDLGLDFNNAHVQPTGAYHYHGSPTSLIKDLDKGEDLVHVGFAHDGFAMYYSKSGKYKSSYKLLDGKREGEDCFYENPHNKIDISVGGHHDGTYGSDFEYVANFGDLDECNGTTINGKYAYIITDEFPYVSRCLMGEYEEERKVRGKQEGQRQRRRPSVDELFQKMDLNKDNKLSKEEIRGPLKDNFSKRDKNKDGYLTEDELKN